MGASDAMVPLENDKPTVVALREIAAGYDITKPQKVGESEIEKEGASEKEEIPAIGSEVSAKEEGGLPS